jgi:hypothetical protein
MAKGVDKCYFLGMAENELLRGFIKDLIDPATLPGSFIKKWSGTEGLYETIISHPEILGIFELCIKQEKNAIWVGRKNGSRGRFIEEKSNRIF